MPGIEATIVPTALPQRMTEDVIANIVQLRIPRVSASKLHHLGLRLAREWTLVAFSPRLRRIYRFATRFVRKDEDKLNLRWRSFSQSSAFTPRGARLGPRQHRGHRGLGHQLPAQRRGRTEPSREAADHPCKWV